MKNQFSIGTALSLAIFCCGCSRGPLSQEEAGSQDDDRAEWQVSDDLVTVSRPWRPPRHESDSAVALQLHLPTGVIKPEGFAGTESCVTCHQGQAETYRSTLHAKAGRPVKASRLNRPARWRHRPSNRLFEVTKTTLGMDHRETILRDNGDVIATQQAGVSFEFGSGTHAHSYLFFDGPFACQSPLTWYVENRQWGLSPGYDPLKRPSFDRAITTGCAFCHVGQVRLFDHNPNHFQILESAIGCERCHGPGQGHVLRHRKTAGLSAGDDGTADKKAISASGDEPAILDLVINPASLSRHESEAVCSQCHLQGALFIPGTGASLWDFQPGQLLAQNRTDFQSRLTADEFRIVGHTEQMHASRCYQESATLTCIACHDPHRHGAGSELVSEHRQACLSCHSNNSCRVDISTRTVEVNNDCATCHMPKRPTDVAHAALHDHRVAIHPESFQKARMNVPSERFTKSPPNVQEKLPVLYPIVDEEHVSRDEKDRRWALATHHMFFNDRERNAISKDMKHAKSILLKLKRQDQSDANVDVALARDYFEAGMVDPAEQLAKEVLAKETNQTNAVINATDLMAQLAIRREDNAAALQYYQQLTRMRRVAGDHYLLGICLINAGNTRGAISVLLESLRIDPMLEVAHEQVAVLFDHHGESDRAQTHRDAVRQIRAYRQRHASK